MNNNDFPKKVTKDNINRLQEKAERIKKKLDQLRYQIPWIVSFIVPTVLIVTGLFSLVFWLLQNHYLDFLLGFSPELQIIIFFVLLLTVIFIISFPTIAFIILSTQWVMRKYFGLPKGEEGIFAECFIIAKYLMNNERIKARKEVGDLLLLLKGFVRDWFNPKRKVYKPEFDLLRSGKTEFCRMLLFSREEIPEFFLMNFGLAFVRNDNPEAFYYLKQLVGEVQKYGEPKGRFRRFLSGMEKYSHSTTFFQS